MKIITTIRFIFFAPYNLIFPLIVGIRLIYKLGVDELFKKLDTYYLIDKVNLAEINIMSKSLLLHITLKYGLTFLFWFLLIKKIF